MAYFQECSAAFQKPKPRQIHLSSTGGKYKYRKGKVHQPALCCAAMPPLVWLDLQVYLQINIVYFFTSQSSILHWLLLEVGTVLYSLRERQ